MADQRITSRRAYARLVASGRQATIYRQLWVAFHHYDDGRGLTARLAGLAAGVDLQSVTTRFATMERKGLVRILRVGPGETPSGRFTSDCAWYALIVPRPDYAPRNEEIPELLEMNLQGRRMAAEMAWETFLASRYDWSPYGNDYHARPSDRR